MALLGLMRLPHRVLLRLIRACLTMRITPIACTVSTTPTTTITAAERAGSALATRPGQREPRGPHDEQPERGQRRRQAGAERGDQQQPERDLVLGDRAEQHHERARAGDQPGARRPSPGSPGGGGGRDRGRGRGAWWCAFARERRTASPTPTTMQPAARLSHGYRSSGSTYALSASVTSPRANTPIVWVTVTIAAERDGIPRAAARADEVRRDHALAVAGRERVHRAPAERGEQQEHEHAVAVEQRLEAVRRAAARRHRGAARPGHRAVAGRHPQRRLAHVGRRAEQRLGVDGEIARRVVDGRRRAHRGAAPGHGADRAPADAAREGAVAHDDGARRAHPRGG